MSHSVKKITALIPCYNEALGIGSVIDSFPRETITARGYELEVVVIDNNSTDDTSAVARLHGATILFEARKGKGNAMKKGFQYITKETDYVIMLDGDTTYRPEECLRLIELLDSGFCSVVVGSRLGGKIIRGSMSARNRLGNWLFSHLVRILYRINITDVLSGYFAWTSDALLRMRPHIVSDHFAIEMEMVTKMARLGEEIYSVPIKYHPREGKSHLKPFRDGMRILGVCLASFFWRPRRLRDERIAFVSDGMLPYMRGGKETRLFEISKRLAETGRDVHIYTMQWWEGESTMVRDGVTYHAISSLYPMYVNGRRSVSEAVMFGLATFKLLFASFDVLDVDQIPFIPLFSARIVTWIRGKKMHATWHEVWSLNDWTQYTGPVLGRIAYAVERWALFLPDVIISNSSHTTKRLTESGVKTRIVEVPLGVDIDAIAAIEPAPTRSDVVFVGRLVEHKHVDTLVEALSIVKKTYAAISCVIIGDGPEREALEYSIRAYSLTDNVRIVSNLESCALYSLMKASRMLVLPSTREGFGLTVLEAHAAGLPVITTRHNNNAAKDLIVEGVNGFLVEPNPQMIADTIVRVLELGESMKPRAHIDAFDWRFVLQRLEVAFS